MTSAPFCRSFGHGFPGGPARSRHGIRYPARKRWKRVFDPGKRGGPLRIPAHSAGLPASRLRARASGSRGQAVPVSVHHLHTVRSALLHSGEDSVRQGKYLHAPVRAVCRVRSGVFRSAGQEVPLPDQFLSGLRTAVGMRGCLRDPSGGGPRSGTPSARSRRGGSWPSRASEDFTLPRTRPCGVPWMHCAARRSGSGSPSR